MIWNFTSTIERVLTALILEPLATRLSEAWTASGASHLLIECTQQCLQSAAPEVAANLVANPLSTLATMALALLGWGSPDILLGELAPFCENLLRGLHN